MDVLRAASTSIFHGGGKNLWSWDTGLGNSIGAGGASALEVNVGSWRVMEKLGMRREGKFVKAIYLDGTFYDDLYYAVLREEYCLKETEAEKNLPN